MDSLWLPEMVYGPLVDPFAGMAFTLGRTSRLKVGTGIGGCCPSWTASAST